MIRNVVGIECHCQAGAVPFCCGVWFPSFLSPSVVLVCCVPARQRSRVVLAQKLATFDRSVGEVMAVFVWLAGTGVEVEVEAIVTGLTRGDLEEQDRVLVVR